MRPSHMFCHVLSMFASMQFSCFLTTCMRCLDASSSYKEGASFSLRRSIFVSNSPARLVGATAGLALACYRQLVGLVPGGAALVFCTFSFVCWDSGCAVLWTAVSPLVVVPCRSFWSPQRLRLLVPLSPSPPPPLSPRRPL